MAITKTTVTGAIYDTSGTAVSGATIIARNTVLYFYGDGSLISPYEVTATSASDGTWSHSLVENVSTSTTTSIIILVGDGAGGQLRQNYQIIVPASGPVTLASLATGQGTGQ